MVNAMDAEPTKWVIEFESMPHQGVPEAMRMKGLLKRALRSHGFRCVTMRSGVTSGKNAGEAAGRDEAADHGPRGRRFSR